MAQDKLADSLQLKAEVVVDHRLDQIDSIQNKFLTFPMPHDSATQAALLKADSIRTGFQASIDSLQGEYTSSLSKIDAQRNALQQKIDSLQQLKLPTDKLTRKLDSLTQLRPVALQNFTNKIEDLKNSTSQSLNEVNLPPQLQEPMSKLKQSIQGYPLPGLDGKIPTLDLPKFDLAGSEFKLPSASGLLGDESKLPQLNLSGKMPKLNNAILPAGQLKDLTGKAGEYGADIKKISTQAGELKDIDKAATTQLSKLDEVQGLKKEMGSFDQLNGLSTMDEEAMKQKLKDAASKEALASLKEQMTDHFAGKEEALKKAMTHISKLKSKFSEVKSLSELPKRAPNPMRGKPMIERIVPGLTFLVQKKDVLLLDVNPVVRFRFTGRFTAGLGWNQRFVFDGWNLTDRSLIYGPRAVLEYRWAKGFHFLVSPELMKTNIPPQLQRTPTESNKMWVPGMFGGLKKEFVVYKKIKGNTEMLYNLYNTHGRSPYIDRFVLRFGFEFPMKKNQ